MQDLPQIIDYQELVSRPSFGSQKYQIKIWLRSQDQKNLNQYMLVCAYQI